jgi:hypothetical protein
MKKDGCHLSSINITLKWWLGGGGVGRGGSEVDKGDTVQRRVNNIRILQRWTSKLFQKSLGSFPYRKSANPQIRKSQIRKCLENTAQPYLETVLKVSFLKDFFVCTLK